MMPSASILSSAAQVWGGPSAKQPRMGIIRCSAAKTAPVEPSLATWSGRLIRPPPHMPCAQALQGPGGVQGAEG